MSTSRAAVLLLGATLLLSGCSFLSDGSTEEGDAGPTLPARTVSKDEWRKGPGKPKRHKPYPYDIATHCGIKWAEFGGRWWVIDSVSLGAEQVKGEPSAETGLKLAGYMTLNGPDSAYFRAAGMPTMQFVPADGEPPPCA
ncbi:hypothetical protein U9R90_27385 [Streptomyces sp. E11-3]|uniref:hypothetical protein n=1 Tax=Streptomyces sp. E11-3 TaxID=3110112 RepID=UPI00397EDC67